MANKTLSHSARSSSPSRACARPTTTRRPSTPSRARSSPPGRMPASARPSSPRAWQPHNPSSPASRAVAPCRASARCSESPRLRARCRNFTCGRSGRRPERRLRLSEAKRAQARVVWYLLRGSLSADPLQPGLQLLDHPGVDRRQATAVPQRYRNVERGPIVPGRLALRPSSASATPASFSSRRSGRAATRRCRGPARRASGGWRGCPGRPRARRRDRPSRAARRRSDRS